MHWMIGGSNPGQGQPGHELTTKLHQVPKLRMSGAIPLLPHMHSWCGKGQLLLYNYVKYRDYTALVT
jgi:hypothetical protein